MENTTIAGTGFKTTTYTYSSMTQTMHMAYRNGTNLFTYYPMREQNCSKMGQSR